MLYILSLHGAEYSLKSWLYINRSKITCHLEKKIHYSLQNSLPLDPVTSQKSLVNALTYSIFKAHFNIILQKRSSVNLYIFSRFSNNICYVFLLLLCVLHAPPIPYSVLSPFLYGEQWCTWNSSPCNDLQSPLSFYRVSSVLSPQVSLIWVIILIWEAKFQTHTK